MYGCLWRSAWVQTRWSGEKVSHFGSERSVNNGTKTMTNERFWWNFRRTELFVFVVVTGATATMARFRNQMLKIPCATSKRSWGYMYFYKAGKDDGGGGAKNNRKPVIFNARLCVDRKAAHKKPVVPKFVSKSDRYDGWNTTREYVSAFGVQQQTTVIIATRVRR